jgi:transcriptional regulator with XRE-family HTH domain
MCARLRQWRLGAELTQRELATKLRKPHSYVWKIESAERRIDPIEFIAWCHACGIHASEAIQLIQTS